MQVKTTVPIILGSNSTLKETRGNTKGNSSGKASGQSVISAAASSPAVLVVTETSSWATRRAERGKEMVWDVNVHTVSRVHKVYALYIPVYSLLYFVYASS